MADGFVQALWRFPVLGMKGEQLRSSQVDTRGIAGDRQHFTSGPEGQLDARDLPRLALWTAAFPFNPDGAVMPDRPPPFPLLTAPNGQKAFRWGDPRLLSALERDLGRPVRVCDDWESVVRGADIVVEAARLERPEPMLLTEWIQPGALVVPYGTMSAVELSLTDIMDKLVVDDWGQCRSGPFGSLRAHVEAGLLSEETLHAELGEIVAGRKPGRESEAETILFWHRGLSLSDIALGHAMLEKAARLGIGQRLRYA